MRKQLTRAAAIAAAALLIGGGAARAQQPTSSTPPNTTQHDDGARKAGTTAKANGTDHTFIRKAAEGGVAEVELGRLAQQKASSNDVKKFAQRMVDDHGKANDQLKTIAQQKNVTVPTQLTGKEKAAYDRLSKLSGEQFDRAYMRLMVEDHRKDVNEFRHVSQTAKDTDVKQFASSTLPTLEDHLKMAEQTASTVGAETRATSGTKDHATKGTSGKSGRTTTGTTGTHEAGGTTSHESPGGTGSHDTTGEVTGDQPQGAAPPASGR